MKSYYKIISEFECCGKHMITIRIGDAVHVMGYGEWKRAHGCICQSRYNMNGDKNRFGHMKGYKRLKVS